jgi:choline dehydrogenase-like flavoprotein
VRADFDIAVIGSGFAGSLMAMIARRLGRSVVLIERGRHPRFAIGESSTPLANLLLEELARAYDLPMLLPLCKWGAWQRTYPQIACGMKRGLHVPAPRHGPAVRGQRERIARRRQPARRNRRHALVSRGFRCLPSSRKRKHSASSFSMKPRRRWSRLMMECDSP